MSDYDRSKNYGKKRYPGQNKDCSGSYSRDSYSRDGPPSNYARNFYGRRSPSGASTSYNKYERDWAKDSTSKQDTTVKIKQPTILLKTREHHDDTSQSPKRSQKDQDLTTSASLPPNTESQVNRTPKTMTQSVKFLEDSILYTDNIQEFIQDNSDFLVVGIIGPQSVGKSTILNLLAHDLVTADVKKSVFKNPEGPKEEEYGDTVKILTESVSDFTLDSDSNKIKNEIFQVQTDEDVESNSNTTKGIDVFITSNRVIFLDCQPFMSVSVLDELVQSDNKRSSIVSEFIPLENSGEILGLQLTTFLMSVCHVLLVVQDYFFDSNIIRFLQTAEMLKPTHSNPEDELSDHFPHLLLLHNKAQMGDFSPRNFRTIQDTYNLLFEKTKLHKDTNLGLASSNLIYSLNGNSCGDPFNVFLIPEYFPGSETIYSGHPPLEDLIKKLRANILGSVKNSLTHVQLTEKTWTIYCSKVWDNVKKSSFFVEYTKLMP